MKVRAVLDRFEGARAILLLGDDETAVSWPKAALPPAAREADVLWFDIGVDTEATRAAKAEAEEMLRELLDRNK